MKSSIAESQKEVSPSYPCLKIKDELVVLFTKQEEGMVMYSKISYLWNVGEYRTEWNESAFSAFHGEVTLTN